MEQEREQEQEQERDLELELELERERERERIMTAMKGQIGPIRMHKKLEQAIKLAATKSDQTAADYMRTAADEKLAREAESNATKIYYPDKSVREIYEGMK